MSVLMAVYRFLAHYPYAGFAVAWTVCMLLGRGLKQSTRMAMDITFLILIGSVSFLIDGLTGSRIGFWLLLFVMLTAAGLKGRELETADGRFQVKTLLKWISRPGFLVLTLLYIMLLLVDITV